MARRLVIGAVLAFVGAVLLGFGVRAGLQSYVITGSSAAPAEDLEVACGSLLDPAHDPDPDGCRSLRDDAQIPALVLAILGVGAMLAGSVVLVTGRPRPAAPVNRNPWELAARPPDTGPPPHPGAQPARTAAEIGKSK